MKKIISVFLALLMFMTCFAVSSLAADGVCTCEEGVHVEGKLCDCCVYCPNPDREKWNTCYRENGAFCCPDCDGIYPCGCACECCARGDQSIEDNDSRLDDVITEQDKENFVDGFQAILKRISDFFDDLFDTIFEFLRLDEVLGRGDELPEELQ